MKVQIISNKTSSFAYTWSETSDGRVSCITMETEDFDFMRVFLSIIGRTVTDDHAMVHVWSNTGGRELEIFPEGHFSFKFTLEGIKELDERIQNVAMD